MSCHSRYENIRNKIYGKKEDKENEPGFSILFLNGNEK